MSVSMSHPLSLMWKYIFYLQTRKADSAGGRRNNAALKAKYRRRLLFRVFDNIETGWKTVYNVEIMTSMRCVKQEFEQIPSEVIGNYWNHCLYMHGAEGSESVLTQIKDLIREQLQQGAEAHDVEYTRSVLSNVWLSYFNISTVKLQSLCMHI